MKLGIKMISVLLLFCLFFTTNQVYATKVDSMVSAGEDFISVGEKGKDKISESVLSDLSNTIYNILLTVGIILAFAVGGILGIKYMLGGIEGQVEVKTMLVPYVIGCAVLFGTFTIWKIIVLILQ